MPPPLLFNLFIENKSYPSCWTIAFCSSFNQVSEIVMAEKFLLEQSRIFLNIHNETPTIKLYDWEFLVSGRIIFKLFFCEVFALTIPDVEIKMIWSDIIFHIVKSKLGIVKSFQTELRSEVNGWIRSVDIMLLAKFQVFTVSHRKKSHPVCKQSRVSEEASQSLKPIQIRKFSYHHDFSFFQSSIQFDPHFTVPCSGCLLSFVSWELWLV